MNKTIRAAGRASMVQWTRIKTVLIFAVLLGLLMLPCASEGQDTFSSAHPLTVSKTGGYITAGGRDKVLVFVHGLFGNADTWRCDADHYWPAMITKDTTATFSGYDVFVAVYDTPAYGGHLSIGEEASVLANRLQQVIDLHRQVVFVSHSLGGVLVEKMLLTHRDWAHKVPLMVLYGTPFEGSSVANIASWIDADPKLSQLKTGEANSTLRDIDEDWAQPDFRDIERDCVYEKRKEKGFRVVGAYSATRGCLHRLPEERNHLQLVKPCDVHDDSYTFLENRLNDLQKKTVSSVGAPQLINPASPEKTVLGETLYERLQRSSEEIQNLESSWNMGILSLQQTFIAPWKHGGGTDPIPSKWPDKLSEDLASLDEGSRMQYRNFADRFLPLQRKILACMNLTINQLASDTFGQAEQRAEKRPTLTELQSGQVDRDRYTPTRIYISDLRSRLGDFPCATKL